MKPQMRSRVALGVFAGIGFLSWPITFGYMWLTTPRPPPAPTSIQDMIVYYGGCLAYRKALHEIDLVMEEEMTSLPGWRERAGVRSAERSLRDAAIIATCRENPWLQTLDTETAGSK